ncbi:MAG: extracellular solute-binding protein [Oscillospiraceae bacterium]|nr:extracellular solute-binding protein [Oscillospiraceae bacterium]
MKKIISILCVLVLLLGLAGCHGAEKKAAFQVPETFDTSRSYEISFWAKNDNNATQIAIYKQAIEDFQTLYPNITVKLKLYSDYGLIYNDVITNISTDTTPNVCITYPDHIATYLSGADTVVPLNDLFLNEKYGFGGSELNYDGPTAEEMVPQFLQECVFGGYYYAVPYMRSTEACYINKTYVEKLGYTVPEVLTWDFIWEVTEAAMEKDGDGNFKVNGQKTMIPFIYKSTDNMMITQLKQKNAGYSTAAGEIQLFNDTTRSLLMDMGEHARTKAFSTFKISGYPGNFLNAGQCIFAVDSTAGATWMGPDAPMMDIHEINIADFEMVIRPVPQFDVQNPKMISQGPSVCVFNKEDPQEVLASWLFTQFLLTNQVQIAYSQTEGYLPVTFKAQNSDTYREYLSRKGEDDDLYYSAKIEAAQLLMNNLDNTFVTPVFNGSASLRNAAGQLVEEVAKAERRKKPVDDTQLDEIFEEVSALYRLDQVAVSAGGEGGRLILGNLPTASVVLLSALAVCWVGIGIFFVRNYRKNKKSVEKD